MRARESVKGGVSRAAAATRRLSTSSRVNMGKETGLVGFGTWTGKGAGREGGEGGFEGF